LWEGIPINRIAIVIACGAASLVMGLRGAVQACDPPPASLSWAVLTSHQRPVPVASNGSRGYLAAATVRNTCVVTATAGGLWERCHGAREWTAVPTAGIARAVGALGYRIGPQSPVVTGLVVAPTNAASLFVVVQVTQAALGSPPVYHVGLVTNDQGRRWQVVPPPLGYRAADFGGFAVEGSMVWSWWRRGAAITALATRRGQHWRPVAPRCEARGLCVWLGPVPAEVSDGSMAPEYEPLVTAVGSHWRMVGWTAVNQQDVPTELARVGSSAVLWVGNFDAPVRVTWNAGRTWHGVTVPPLPGWRPADGYPAVTLLTSGTLLASGPDGVQWYTLRPGGRHWHLVSPGLYVARPYAVIPDGTWVLWVRTDQEQGVPSRSEFRPVPVKDYAD
jgi:hypothetical protein